MNYQVHFFGNFRLISPDGADLAPSSARHRALLALVAESPDLRRSRRWIEDRLWSMRDAKQAGGSFREALRMIRKALGDHADLLQANRSDVWLDQSRVKTDLEPGADFAEAGREFLEGLDIRDPEFEDWLREKRAIYEVRTEAPRVVPMASTPQTGPSHATMNGILVSSRIGRVSNRAEGMAAQLVADCVATNFEDWFGSWVRANSPQAVSAGDADLEVVCDVTQDGGVCVTYVNVNHVASGRLLFSGHRSYHGSPLEAVDRDTVAGLIHAAASKVSSKVPVFIGVDRAESVAAGLAHFGKQRLLTFDPESMDEAYGLMSQARAAHEHGVFVAWQAFIRMAQLVDTFCDDREGKADDLRALSAEALEVSGDNALAVALVAIARSMGQVGEDDSAQLAKQALKLNPKNLFARQAMALVRGNSGDIKGAYTLSKSCQSLLPDDDSRHLWDLYHALVCIAAGRTPEALTSAERASARCTEFNAPRRQLLGLYLHENRIEEAKTQFELLRKYEPGFAIDRFFKDPSYPVDTLRQGGLVNAAHESIFS